jgi:chaperonin GroES
MDEIKIQPLGARVLIRADQRDESNRIKGIYVPETSEEKPHWGEVVAIGDQKDEIKVRVGNKVLYSRNSGTEIKINSTQYLIMEANDLLAIIKD